MDSDPTEPAGEESKTQSVRFAPRFLHPQVEALPAGERVGRYVVIDLVGRGGMGAVYRAYDPELNRRVAVKLLRVAVTSDARVRLVREAQALAQLSHPNVVSVHDVGATDAGQLFLAMEYVEGKTLKAWLADEPRATEEILGVFVDAARGLLAAHRAGMVHRDFKPDNVIVGDDGRVRVLDFGLARAPATDCGTDSETAPTSPELVSGSESSGGLLATPLTEAGLLIGTPAYMAPEQLRREPVGKAADQFSLCAALYEALYETRPFHGKLDERLANIEAGNLAPPKRARKLPTRVRTAMLRGLAARPEQRLSSLEELVDALRPARGRRRIVALVAAAALLSGVALVALGQGDRGATCGAEAQWRDAWHDGASQLAGRFGGAPAGDEAVRRFVGAVEAYGARWIAEYEQLCATDVAAPEVRAARQSCLSDRRRAVESLLETLGETTRDDFIAHGLHAAHLLPSFEPCREPDGDRGLLPQDPGVRADVEAIRADLRRVEILRSLHRYDDAAALAREQLARARALQFDPLVAEALVALGTVAVYRMREEEAHEPLREGAAIAAAAGDIRTAAMAWTELIGTTGALLRRFDDARLVAGFAEQGILLAGDPPEIRARYLWNLAWNAFEEGRYADALAHDRAALAHLRRLHGDEHPVVIEAYSAVSDDLRDLGRLDEALAHATRAHQLSLAVLGEKHPQTATMSFKLSEIEVRRGELASAWTHGQRALALRRELHGERSPGALRVMLELGVIAREKGDLGAARTLLTETFEGLDAAGEAHARSASDTLFELAVTEKEAGELRTALAVAVEAQERSARIYADGHLAFAETLGLVGELHHRLGQLAEARDYLERALVAGNRTGLPGAMASRHAALARLLVDVSPPARARATALASEARRLWQDQDDTEAVAELDAWAAKHGLRIGAASGE